MSWIDGYKDEDDERIGWSEAKVWRAVSSGMYVRQGQRGGGEENGMVSSQKNGHQLK